MKLVDPPKPPERLPEHKLRKDVQFLAWLARRNKHQQHPLRFSFDGTERGGDLEMGKLDPDQLAHIAEEIEKRRHGHGSDIPDLVHKEMVASTPKLGQPDFTDLGEDLSLMLGQPEMLEMWARWRTPRQPGARGEWPNDAPAKAALAVMGMDGLTHAERACERLQTDPGLRLVFAGVEKAAYDLAQAKGIAVPPTLKPFTLSLYEGTIGRFPFLSGAHVPDGLGSHKPTCRARELMLGTNGLMFKALRELYPDAGFGQTLLIDGSLVPAWCEQAGTGSSDEIERQRRRTCPEAGSRAIRYTGSGKADIEPGGSVPANQLRSAKHVRGYYYVVLLDQLSGWPLVSTLVDASKDEAIQLIALLSDLYKFHPGIDVKRIVGDGAWDEDWAHATCEMDYGIAPVFRNTARAEPENDIVIPAGETQSKDIVGYTHLGQLRHPSGSLLKFDGFERPDRHGLNPGQPCKGKPGTELYDNNHDQRSRLWRVRAVLQSRTGPARRIGLKVRVDWRRLNEYPRFADATTPRMRRKYAARQALMYRLRNQMEGYFSRVKTSLKLGGKDASRVRFQSLEVYETLLHLGELRFNSLSLAQERFKLTGVGAPPLPDGVLGPLPAQNQGGHKAAAGYQRANGAGWSTGTVPRRLRGGQQAPPPVRVTVPSAMPAAARVARDPITAAGQVGAQPAQQVAQPPSADPVAVAPAVASAGDGDVLPDNVIRVDFTARQRAE